MSRDHAWRPVAVSMFVIGWGGNQFTPLLGVYRSVEGYSQLDVDVFLGAYVVGLVPGLLVASALSDRYGRRPVMVGGLVASVIGSLFLAAAEPLGADALLIGRALSGIAVGIAMAVGTAWVTELSEPPYAEAAAGTGARRAAGCLSAGLGLGPGVAGILAQWTRPALLWPFLLHAALVLPALVALVRTGVETHSEPGAPLRLAHRLRVPAAGHRRFVRVVLPMAPWIFGSAGIAYAIVPQVVHSELGDGALLFTTALTVATLGTGVLVQPLARRLDDRSTSRAVTVSMVLMSLGVVAAALTAGTHAVWLAVVVALLLGAAYGIAVVSGLQEVQRIAAPDERAGLTGVYYALAYVGFLLPALLAGLSPYVDYPTMLLAVAVVAAGCTAVCGTGWAKHLPVGVTTAATNRVVEPTH